MKTIYVDNAGTTAVSKSVIDAMLPIMTENFGNASSLHFLGQQAKEILNSAREKIAKCIGANADEIIFTSGGSESDNMALISLAYDGKKKGKTHIVSSVFEHHAILHTLQKLEREGFEVTYLPVYKNGIVKLDDLKKAVKDTTAFVTIMFANNEIGTIQPIAEIGAYLRDKNIPFHTDAVQAVGHIKLDVKAQNIDMLSMSAHKFHGPKGVGAVYVRRGVRINSLILGGAQERNLRAGTENVAGIYGMAIALEEATNNLTKNTKHLKALRDKTIKELSKIEHSCLNGDADKRLPNNVNMCFEGIEGEALLLLLSDEGICASSGSACTSGSLDPSHVLLAIGLPHDVAHGSLRLTFSEDNTMEDVDKIVSVVRKTVEYLRTISPVWDKLKKGEIKHVI